MIASRRPLGPINSNIIPHKDLSPYIRGKIMEKLEEGKKPAHIAKELKIAKSTIRDTIKNDPLRNEGASRPRPGWPDKYSDRFKRRLIAFGGQLVAESEPYTKVTNRVLLSMDMHRRKGITGHAEAC
ncbi:hypothetical protein BDZ45DRAFT_808476 [Acephala macrosclerotiorum]|nr:hypothetical protein BDZ45DRAFT_808476 [Acephala macrosclerotiorum]